MASILSVAGQAAVDGTPFGRYRLMERLRRGGMVELRTYDTAPTNRIVAIQLRPSPVGAQDRTNPARILQEVRGRVQRCGNPVITNPSS
jgi:hypothetical protein